MIVFLSKTASHSTVCRSHQILGEGGKVTQLMPDMVPNAVRFWTDVDLPGLEIRSSSYQRCSFSKHAHDTWSVGTVLNGQGRFTTRGTTHSIGQGQTVVIPPEELHACNPRSKSLWAYLMFHLSDHLLREVAKDVYGEHPADPVFTSQVVSDPEIHCLMVGLFELVKNGATRLEKETAMLTFLSELLVRHAKPTVEKLPWIVEPRTVALIKEYLSDNLEKNVSMKELSDHVGVSMYHMLGVFRRAVGMPPHAYQVQMRIKEARKLLLKGYSIADAALETGFCDQSHFTKKFKPSVGLTPRSYIRAYRSS